RPVDTERPGNLFDLPATLCLRHQDKGIHEPVLPYEEQGVEDDRLSKSNGQNGLNQNFGGRPGIAADYVRSFSADHAYRYSSSKSRQAYVQIRKHCVSSLLKSFFNAEPLLIPLPRTDKSAT